MIDPKRIMPLLTNMTVDGLLASGPSAKVYLVTRRIDGKKLALKHISIPATDSETRALIYAGAVKDEAAAQRYYTSQVKDLKNEMLLLNGVKNAANLLKFRGYQVDQKYTGVGYDVYLLSDYSMNLPEYMEKHPLTRLQAVNLAIDLCAALEQLRTAGLIHKDVHPKNIYHSSTGHFMLGDLGLTQISELPYSSIPDAMVTPFTAPEVIKEGAVLSQTMDIYSVGMILYWVYAGGELPLAQGEKRKKKQELPAPAYADTAMTEIILRACAYAPENRYQDPTEMKQALVLYLQRGGASSELLVPPPPVVTPEKSPDDASVDVSEIAATVAAGQAAERAANAPEGEAPAEPAADSPAEAPAEVPEEEPDPVLEEPALQEKAADAPARGKSFTKNQDRLLSDEKVMTPDAEEETTVEEFMDALRKSSGLEVYHLEEDGSISVMPGYETEETLPDDTEFIDSADNHFAVLQNLGEITPDTEDAEPSHHPAQDDELDEYFDESGPLLQDPDAPAETVDEPEEAPAPARPAPRRRRNDDVNSYDVGDDTDEDNGDEDYDSENEGGSTWKKALIAVIVLMVIAAGCATMYLFKTDTVSNMKSQVLSSTSVSISADLKNDTAMDVVATSTTGQEVARVPFNESGTTVTGLSPNTTYSFTLSSTDGKLLLGSKKVTLKTNEMTNITAFSPTALGATTATIALGGVGPQPDQWVITLTSDSGENLTFYEAEIPADGIVLDGLTPNTHYTAVLATDTEDTLGGTTTCEFTTMAYTELTTFQQTSITTSSVSLSWGYTGTVPDTWTVTCEGTDGSSATQDVTGTECTLDGLTSGVTYNITLSTPSLKPTEAATISVGIPSITVSGVTSTLDDDGNVEVSWDYTGDVEPGEWRVSYAYIAADGTEVTPTTATTDKTSITLTGLIPDTSYKISVVGADELSVGGDASTTIQTGDAKQFTGYGCTDVSMDLYVLEDNQDSLETPSSTFTTSQHIAFAIEASYEATDEDKSVDTTYVIRDSSGNPVQVYTSTRSWKGSWTISRHTGDLPNTIPTPGDYTLEVYFDGDLMASADFTVTE